MTNEVVLKVEGLYKKFSISMKRSMFYGSLDVARSMLGIPYRTDFLRKSEFWALKNINFELKRGETLGIVGANGSGKSTLLRMITGIFPPDAGKITVKGRVGSLIAVGAGFHPHMTGRENIYLNGTILGMSKVEIDRKIDDIILFADIHEFLEAPVSTYSSGMRVRLGFSIAVHCEPDILLIDEVLSVGDLSFRNKCLRKIAELREKAKGIIFISHDLEQIKVLCDRVIVINKGIATYEGNTFKGLCHYQDVALERSQESYKTGDFIKKDSLTEKLKFLDIGVLDVNDRKVDVIDCSDSISVFCDFETTEDINDVYFSVGILNEEYKPCVWVISNDPGKLESRKFHTGKYRLKVVIKKNYLAPNIYFPNIVIRDSKTNEMFERVWAQTPFRVISNGKLFSRGFINVDESWEIQNTVPLKENDAAKNIF